LAWLALLLCVSACPLLGDDDDDDTADDDAADDDADDDTVDDDSDDDDADDDNDVDDDADDDDADDDDNNDADDDDDDNDNDDATPPDLWGGVSVSEGYSSSNYTALDYYCGAGASFYDPDDVPGWGDPLDENGDCILYAVTGGGTAMDTLSAGTITVTGTNIGAIHLTPTPYAYGYYYQADVNFLEVDNLFDSGDNLAAHINGLGQFDELDLQIDAPPLLSVT
jgi:hypothetical protein